MILKEMSFEEFQDCHCGGQLGYRNGKVLAILNLRVTVMPPIKFWLNPTYCSGGDMERNDFSNSESLCRCYASHQVSAQSDFRFGRRCRLNIETERF